MNIFVASWFFPPSTSSEGIVTYKLLKNSRFHYDVVSAKSNRWGYKTRFEAAADNICVIPVITDELEEWRDKCIQIFEQRHADQPYDAIMTRAMPSTSIEVGLAIKERHPSLPWICSLADPIANNPYMRYAINNIQELSKSGKKKALRELALPRDKWSINWQDHPSNTIRDQFFWKDIQDQALKKADLLISPVREQLNYIDSDGVAGTKYVVIPHTFDESFYSQVTDGERWESSKIHLTFTGYSDTLRSLNPFLNAVRWVRDYYPNALQKIKIHFFGNYPREIVDRALAWQIDDVFDFSGNISYLETLAIMKKSDWLLHVDAWFEELRDTGGSIFFAGKLADYMGAGKPILALTGKNSPAANMIAQYGGVSIPACKTAQIGNALIKIASGDINLPINEDFRSNYRADSVAARFDVMLENMLKQGTPPASEQVFGGTYSTEKALTVCVPSYNAQKTLRRTLDSLLAVESRDALEVIVVDDGSVDGTAGIGKEYVERYPNSVMMVSKPNGGHGSGINQGIKRARGQYLRIVDSDDWVDSKALNAEICFITECAQQPDVIYTPYHIIDQQTGESKPWAISKKIEFNRIYRFEELVSEIGVTGFYFTMHGTSFRTQLLRDIGFHSKEKSFYTDSEFILKPIPYVKTAVFLSKPVYKYLCGQNGQSVAPASFVRNYEQHEAILRDLIQYEQCTSMSFEHRQYMYHYLNEHLITNYRILLEYDPQLKNGLEKTERFDRWLRETAPLYYDWTQKNIPLLRRVRQSKYDTISAQRAKKHFVERNGKVKQRIRKEIKLIRYSPLFVNRFSMRMIRKQKESNGWLYKLYSNRHQKE